MANNRCKWTGHLFEPCGQAVLPRVNHRGRTIIQNETKWVHDVDDHVIRKHIIEARKPFMDGGNYCYYHRKLRDGLLEAYIPEERQWIRQRKSLKRVR